MSRPVSRRLAFLGGTLGVLALLGVGLALAATDHGVAAAPSSVVAVAPGSSGVVTMPSPHPVPAADPATTAPAAPPAVPVPTTVAPKAPTTTVARATAQPASPAPAAAATPGPTTPAAAAAKPAPGQRVNPTTAQVQAAVTQLHQRIPLFAPTDAQLRTFADAVCTSFDQGQTLAQVQSTVQQAVSRIQGQSLSAPDAQFAVQIVTQLRCPGYLP
jgi:hypothetical protein